MADSDPSLSTTVNDAPVVSDLLPAEERKALDDSFASFFEEIDSKAEAPSAPGIIKLKTAEGAETHKEPAEKEEPVTGAETQEVAPKLKSTRPEPKAPEIPDMEPEPVTAKKAETDIDSLELHPNANAKSKSEFSKLKEIAKASISDSKIFRSKLEPVLKQFGLSLSEDPDEVVKTLEEFGTKIATAQRPQVDPAMAEELEAYRVIGRASAIDKSFSYQRGLDNPLKAEV